MSKRVRRGPRESRALRTAILERRTGAVSATAFEFFSTTAQIRKVRAVMEKLLDVPSAEEDGQAMGITRITSRSTW